MYEPDGVIVGGVLIVGLSRVKQESRCSRAGKEIEELRGLAKDRDAAHRDELTILRNRCESEVRGHAILLFCFVVNRAFCHPILIPYDSSSLVIAKSLLLR